MRAGLYLLIVALSTLLLAGCDLGRESFSPSTPTRVQPTGTAPPTTGTDTPPTSAGTATATPTSTAEPGAAGLVLPVSIAAVPAELPEYDRGTWRHWTDEDGDCQNARQEVLIDESTIAVTFQTEDRCRVATGLWEGPYTGAAVDDPGNLDVDHMVPLENAHRSGGWGWSRERKREYANYLGYENHLIAATSGANRSKGSKGPEEWRPPLEDYWCIYALDWVSIKNEWGLTVTEDEYVALSEMLAICETTVLLQPAQGTPPSPPTLTVPPSLPADLRYDPFGPDRDCGDFDTYQEALAFFIAAGGPENDRHRLDVNGDGAPCETLPGGPSSRVPGESTADSAMINFSGIGGHSECGPLQLAALVGRGIPADCRSAQFRAGGIPFSPGPSPVPAATPDPPLPTASPTHTPGPPPTASPTPTPRPPPELAPEVANVEQTPAAPTGFDCGDFASWTEAQEFYLASGGPEIDPHGLDADGDGIVCRSLSGAPSLDKGVQPSGPVPVAAPTPVPAPELTPAAPAFVDLPYDPDGPDRNCDDFASWWDAQNFYLAAGGPAQDPHGMDRDGDGIACASLLAAAAGPPDPGTVLAGNAFEDRNCSDFATWQDANEFFLAEGGPHSDRHRLDRNSDGVPCESLPGAPQRDSGSSGQDTQPAPTATPQSVDAGFQDRNCSDFESWQEAQDFFLSEGGPSEDPHRLDGDGNGVACQSLRGAPGG